jgi:hypothetical protein
MDPGLLRDDDHASGCAQFDYTFASRNPEARARLLPEPSFHRGGVIL